MIHSTTSRRLALATAGVALSTIALVGCSSAPGEQGTTAPAQLNIGFFGTENTNSYEQAMIDGANQAAADLNVKLTVLSSNFDVQTQNNQMQLALQRKSYDAWVVAYDDGDQQCNQFKQAVAAGVPIVLGVNDVCGGDRTGAVGFVGVQTAGLYTQWWNQILSENEPQQIAVLTGPPLLSLTNDSEAAMKAAMAKYPGFTVVSDQHTDYSTGQAFQVAGDTLRAHPDLKVIVSTYAGMTQGVVQAVKAAGLQGKVKVYDLLGDKFVADAIKSGDVAMTIPGLPYDEGYDSVQMLVQNANGTLTGDKPVSLNPADNLKLDGGPFVTKDNIAQFTAQY